MIKIKFVFVFSFIFFSCKDEVVKIKPQQSAISESIYASGIVKSRGQYDVYATVNGIIDSMYVEEGDTVKMGAPLLTIANETQRLSKEIAALTAAFSDLNANRGKLNEANQTVQLSVSKMKNDSALYFRQLSLWNQQIGSKMELEQRELAYQNSKAARDASIIKYNDLKRQLEYTSAQSKKNLLISGNLENDYVLRSEMDGIVYSLSKSKGEMVNAQTPVAVIGDATLFVLEMQVDEFDILKIKKGQTVLVTPDSYKGQVFEALVTLINPLMNERSKTFAIEAEFVQPPEVLFPNITFEANIVIQSKESAMLLPRNFLIHDSLVIKANGDTVAVKTGLKDYEKIEIISGIGAEDELIKPAE